MRGRARSFGDAAVAAFGARGDDRPARTTRSSRSVAEALAPLRDGMTILCGGFGLSGNPEALIKGVVDRGVRDLTLVSNNAGNLGKGLAQWLRAGIIRR